MVEMLLRRPLRDICLKRGNTLGPRREVGIATRLGNSSRVDVEGSNMRTRIALCRHKCDKSRACADVKNRRCPIYIGPRTDKHAIRTYLHSTQLVVQLELLELKHITTLITPKYRHPRCRDRTTNSRIA